MRIIPQRDSAWLCADKSAGMRTSVECGWIEVGVRVKWGMYDVSL